MSGAGGSRGKRISFVDPATVTPHFSWRKVSGKSGVSEEVCCEGLSLSDIAAKAGTPAYVYSQTAIGDAYRELDSGLGALPHTLCFAVKSNGNLAILKYLAGLGSGFDVVSGGELQHLQRIGVPGKRIVFSGVGKSREEMREALRYGSARRGGSRGILLFNIESEAELAVLLEESGRGRRRGGGAGAVAIRVNTDGQGGGGPTNFTEHARHRRWVGCG